MFCFAMLTMMSVKRNIANQYCINITISSLLLAFCFGFVLVWILLLLLLLRIHAFQLGGAIPSISDHTSVKKWTVEEILDAAIQYSIKIPINVPRSLSAEVTREQDSLPWVGCNDNPPYQLPYQQTPCPWLVVMTTNPINTILSIHQQT